MKKTIHKFLIVLLLSIVQLQSSYAACPFTVLDGAATSGNARAPVGTTRYQRTVYLITASEMAAAGFGAQNITSITWLYNTAASASVTGNLAVYFENTTNTTFSRSATVATALSTMTNSRPSAAYTLPGTPTTSFEVPITTPFAYTGGGLYVAFDWSNASNPLSTGTVVACNTALSPGLYGVASNASLPTAYTASSAFRPVTKFKGNEYNSDASVDYIYQNGKIPAVFSENELYQALITNKGNTTLTNLDVTLAITGANTFSPAAVTIASLAPCASTVVSFPTFTSTTTGTNTVTVSVPSDDNNANNSLAKSQIVTTNLYDTRTPGQANAGGVGFTGGTGAFIGKFHTSTAATINEVQVDFTSSGNAYRLGIYAADGTGGTPGTLLYTDAADRTTSVGTAFAAISPAQAIPAGDFYVGIRQTGTTNVGFQYSTENPIRDNIFYYNSPTDPYPADSWAEFNDGGVAFRLNIAVQFYIPQPPNCALSTSPADATNPFCFGSTFSWASGGGGPTGYDVYLSQTQADVDNEVAGAKVSSNQAGTTYDPGALTPNTVYYWKVVPRNADGPATGCTTSSFTTGASATLPFTEDFSGATFPPTCWSRSNSTYIYRGAASYQASGTGSVIFDFWNLASGNIDLTTPTFDATPVNYALSFNYAYATAVTEEDSLKLYTSTDGGVTYTLLDQLDGGPAPSILNTGGTNAASIFIPTGSQWNTYQIVIPTGTNKIKFTGKSGYGNALYLDNIGVDAAPPLPACVINASPVDLATDAAKDETLSWSADPAGGAPTGYDVYFSTVQADVTSSSATALVSSNQAGSTYVTSGLNSNTTYYWKAVPKNLTGSASGCATLSFTTGTLYNYCTPVYSQGCGTSNITNVTFNTINNTSTCSGQAYTAFPKATANTSVPQGYNFNLSVTTDQSCIISCWIDYDQDGLFEASEWTQVTTASAANTAATASITIDAAATLGDTKMRIRTRYAGNANGSGDACSTMGSGEGEDYVITIIAPPVTPPSCTTVTTSNTSCVTASRLSWTAATNFPQGYSINFGTDNPPTNVLFAAALGNVLSYNLPTLSPNTTYYYQIVPSNTNGDAVGCPIGTFTSGASVAYTPTIASPYNMGFEGVTVPALPCGITTSDENFPQDGFTWTTSSTAPKTGTSHMRVGANPSVAKDDWFYSNPLNLTAGKLYRAYFNYRVFDGTKSESFEVFVSSGADASTMLTTSSVYTKNSINSVVYINDSTADIIPVVSGVYYLGFHANSPAAQTSLYIDDIKVKNIPVSGLQPASCTTVNSMYTPIYCSAYPGATNYKYKIENLASSFSYEYTRNNALTDFRLKWAPGVTFGVTYDVSVSAYANGTWTSYGPSCQVTTGPFPTNKLNTASCNSTISSLATTLTCDSISGANDYEYRIVNSSLGYDYTWRRITGATDYKLSWAYSSNPFVQGLPYGYTYDVQVRALVGRTAVLPGNWGTFGPVCTVTVTGTPQTQLTVASCGSTLASFTSLIYCIPVAGATDYEWRVSNATLGYSQSGTRTNSTTNYRLDWLPNAGGGIRYATTYDVEVRAKVGGVFGSFGPVCQLTTPASPITSLQPAYCSNYALPTFSSQVFCVAVPGVTNYRYRITGPNGYNRTFTRNSGVNDWRFSWTISSPPNQNMIANATYSVEVASYAGGVWSAYGPACTILTPLSLARTGYMIDENAPSANNLSLSVFPNPASSSNLAIILDGITEANTIVNLSVYNMIGKKVYGAEITTAEENRMSIRPETTLAPGIYMTEAVVNGSVIRHKFVVE